MQSAVEGGRRTGRKRAAISHAAHPRCRRQLSAVGLHKSARLASTNHHHDRPYSNPRVESVFSF